MVNRDNWKLTRQYMDYLSQIKQRDQKTIEREKSSLRHLLEWADSASFARAWDIQPIYPKYLVSLELGHASVDKHCSIARNFFRWMRQRDPHHTRKLTDIWLDTIKPVKFHDLVGSHDAYTLPEIRQLCAWPGSSLTDCRDQAAVALLFISGMRVGSFVTMPIECLDLETREVRQWPEKGMEVKNNMRATTYMLDIPDLLEVSRRWDDIIRPQLPVTARWFTPLSSDGMQLSRERPGQFRTQRVADALKRLCDLADVRYRNTHQIRHGHASYAMGLCHDMADYKAVSANMLHLDIATTDRVYAELSSQDVKRRIEGLK